MVSDDYNISAYVDEEVTGWGSENIDVDTGESAGAQGVRARKQVYTKSTKITASDPLYAWGKFPLLTKVFTSIRRNTKDFGTIYSKLVDDFFNTNKGIIFSQAGAAGLPGFKDLNASTKAIKSTQSSGELIGTDGWGVSDKKHLPINVRDGFSGQSSLGVYPILVRTGALMASLTNRGDTNAIGEINGSDMILGTREKHAIFHQAGTRGGRISYNGVNSTNTDFPMGNWFSSSKSFNMAKRPPVQFNVGKRPAKWRAILSKELVAIRADTGGKK